MLVLPSGDLLILSSLLMLSAPADKSSWYKPKRQNRSEKSGEWGILNISVCQEMFIKQETSGKKKKREQCEQLHAKNVENVDNTTILKIK